MRNVFVIAVLAFASSAFAQSANDPAAAAQKWIDRGEFKVFWFMGGYSQTFTAVPKSQEFRYHSRDFCERNAPATYTVKEGKLVITIKRPSNCGVQEMVFDPVTKEALEFNLDGQPLVGRTLRLGD